MDSTTDIFTHIEADGEMTYVTDTEEMLGRTRQEFLGTLLEAFIHPEDNKHAFTVDGVAVAPGTFTVDGSRTEDSTEATDDESTAGTPTNRPLAETRTNSRGGPLLSALVLSVIGYLARRRGE